MKKWLGLIFFAALFLRLYRIGLPVLKEDENTTVKAAGYIYHCWTDRSQCRHEATSFKSRTLALLTANETIPNLFAEIYRWDFIKKQTSQVHDSRAWPQLYLVAGVYKLWGISELSSRLVSVVAGSLLVLAGYWLARTLGSSVKLSLVYSGLLAFAFPLIDFARNARMYSLDILVFTLLVGLIYRRHWLSAAAMFFLAYQLQMLTLILSVALLVWSIWVKRWRLLACLFSGLFLIAGLDYFFGVDFFARQFLTFSWPPHWQYLNWWWVLVLTVLVLKRQAYLLAIIGTYFLALIFFTRPAPAAAYLIALWPLGLWALLQYRHWLTALVAVLVVVDFGLHLNYLYFGRDGRAQVNQAYRAIRENFHPGDRIYAVQLRDYYLQDLPQDTPVIDLQANPNQEFTGSGFVVWEEEKAGHLNPETLAYIKNHFQYLGSGGVEIYRFGK